MREIFLFIALLLLQVSITAQSVNSYNTITYHLNDTLSSELDYFSPSGTDVNKKPLVIFVHGGGFSGGKRAHGYPFCRFLADSGIHSATINYPLYMKGKDFSCGGILTEKIKAIQLAAYHAHLATVWFLNHADSLSIDTSRIYLAGSSAGAEAVLQAVYWDRAAINFFPNTLSETFKYAGVISGAGAILDINMIHSENIIPTICFHGTCDPLVPYHIAAHHYCDPASSGFMMLFGSMAIHERLSELNGCSQMITYCGDGHQHAGTPFYGSEMQTVLHFIERTVKGESFINHTVYKNNAECIFVSQTEFCDP